MTFRYLSIALYHPSVLRGGAQAVAKDLFDVATADPDCESASLLAAIDTASFPEHDKVGAAITRLGEAPNEYLLLTRVFDSFYHVVYDARRQKALRRFLRREKPDVVHVHHSLLIGLEALELIRQECPQAKIVYTLHEYLPICFSQGQLYRYPEMAPCHDPSPHQCIKCFPHLGQDEFLVRKLHFQSFFKLVDRFVAPSEYLRREYVKWGLPEDRIATIPNGHRSARPAGHVPTHGAQLNRFGFFGQFVNAKGVDVLLSAADSAGRQADGEIEIYIFGGNKQYATAAYREQIERIVAGMPPNVSVREMGGYSRENVFHLMNTVDWVVTPSVWPETFGLVVSEAWDARRPVLASAIGGLGERIRHMENGISFLAGSASSLADWMLKCLGNAELWRKLVAGITDEIGLEEAWAKHKSCCELANPRHG
jgi:glycosyltransferase involved in cell wall biosynthesis